MNPLEMVVAIVLSVFGVFGSFSFYLPELFPMRLRGTGSGFCYNVGRIATACFPFGIGVLMGRGVNPLEVIRWIALAPLAGVVMIMLGLAVETKSGRDGAIAGGEMEAGADGGLMAEVAGERKRAPARVLLVLGPEDFPGAVARAIVHADDLVVGVPGARHRRQPGE